MTIQDNSTVPSVSMQTVIHALTSALDQLGVLEVETAQALQKITNKQSDALQKLSADGNLGGHWTFDEVNRTWSKRFVDITFYDVISGGGNLISYVFMGIGLLGGIAGGTLLLTDIEKLNKASEIVQGLSKSKDVVINGGMALGFGLQGVARQMQSVNQADAAEWQKESESFSATNKILLKQTEEAGKGSEALGGNCALMIELDREQKLIKIRG